MPGWFKTETTLNEQTCCLIRDAHKDFKLLERMFGTLPPGCAFGESIMVNMYDTRTRFYSAIALTDCVVLQISRYQYTKVVQE